MSAPVIIREAREADLAAIVAMLADDMLGKAREDVAPGPLHADYAAAFAAIAAAPQSALYVVDRDGRAIGCAQLTFVPGLSSRGAWRAIIESVRVDAAWRGQGIGATLIGDLLARAKAFGCASAQLTTAKPRKDAQRFYARLGFGNTHEGFKIALI